MYVLMPMGRTVPSFRPAIDREIESWKPFARGLRPADRDIFEALADYARVHADAGSLANRALLSEVIFMSVVLEHEKTVRALRAQVAALEDEVRQLRQQVPGAAHAQQETSPT
jgi:phage shock protein A